MIELLLISICVPCLMTFIYYVIGSPSGSEYYIGRPLSFYGRFVAKNYKKFEENQSKKLNEKFTVWKMQRDKEIEVQMQVSDIKKLLPEYQSEIDKKRSDIEEKQQLNYWMALGSCKTCFFTWLSLLIWAVVLILFNYNLLLLFLLSPTSVVLSKYLHL